MTDLTKLNLVSASEVANFFIRAGNYKYTNLKIQKLVYLAHLLYLSETCLPLVREDFEAWMYGAVVPKLYRQLIPYGAGCISEQIEQKGCELTQNQECFLSNINKVFGKATSAKLVEITHSKSGAWAQVYQYNNRQIIPPELINAEALAIRNSEHTYIKRA
ncbi:Panacea domain-containing protein [Bartonella sp. DGB1]|uniref:Panacea domain-containing protein n=1 Tax=Bartonella sp. DGB1 TaxID=3239807 RepID=UPI003524A631